MFGRLCASERLFGRGMERKEMLNVLASVPLGCRKTNVDLCVSIDGTTVGCDV